MPEKQRGFTLIEMSIVLVIIGLIVGGVLVGQDLIRAAGVRATVTQIEKYNTAVNTFRTKYNNQLPGDIDATDAAQFGFAARGTCSGETPCYGEGDGNGIIEGVYGDAAYANGAYQGTGESAMFWVDLSQAGLIDGGFNSASTHTPFASMLTGAAIDAYLPSAKLGGGNYIYVWSGGISGGFGFQNGGDGLNYFGLLSVGDIQMGGAMDPQFPLGLTVQQAYAIDKKIDDGIPQTGNVTALYISDIFPNWAGASSVSNGPTTAATPGSANTCYDNGNVGGATQQYSVEINGGAGLHCALSFRFQ